MSSLVAALRRPASQPTRFVVLSQPRTGSSLLCGSIRWHPQILMQGEVLNQHYHRTELPETDGAERLRVALSAGSHDAVGCKLHACQPDPGRDHWESAWDYVADDPTIKVIHLYRENRLAQLASWKIAELLGQWGDQSEVPERPTIEIARGELTWFDRFNTALYRARLNRLTRHPLLKVSYESLRDDWPFTLHRVLAFLGVEQLALDQCAIRGETRPLSEVISNYHEFIREAA
jgi:LPS sulfotransferase NodH